ncbi:hypothetical protein FO519_006919 [Halicephalobus sp. NKZ332]|nr:hypothetical protein FO519_006919 [Halicephalobus sp. NKZ332]
MTTPFINAAKPPVAPPSAGRSTLLHSLRQSCSIEPPFRLRIEPETKISFKSDRITEEPVKCTSNDIFRVRPPMGFIAPGETFLINLILKTKKIPISDKHFFAFYHTSCKDDDQNPRALWASTTKPEGVKRVPCEFLKVDGTNYIPSSCKMIPSAAIPSDENNPINDSIK